MIKRLRFEKLKNTRDLGGFVASNGKKIRSGLLFRSGALANASVNDLNLLINKYNIKTVIDLRTDAEITNAPDPVKDIPVYIKCPILDDSFLGIARDEYTIDAWLNIFKKKDVNPAEIYSDMYMKLVFDEHIKKYFNIIFNLFAETDDPVLWHCSAGKDRVGVTTALLLSVLGVPRETIIKDYLMTEYFTFPEIAKVTFFGSIKYHNLKVSESIRILMGVRAYYLERIFKKIDSEYESVDKFLSEQYGISKAALEKIRNKYLE